MMRSIFYLLLILGVSSCGNDVYFEQNQELSPKLQWQKSDKKTFNVKVDDLASKFQMKLNFRYVEGFAHKTFKVKVTEISPSKVKTVNS